VARANGLDDLDKALIRALQRDGRESYSALAKQLGVTEGTVRNRLSRLLAERIIRIVGVADLPKVGMHAAAITGINVERSKIRSALRTLMEMPEVRFVAVTTGTFDLIVEVVLPDNDMLHDFLIERLAAVPGVTRTDTSMLLKIHKQSYTWLPEPEGNGQAPRGRITKGGIE
jgi:Lrp/AsnC family transcriptional regulator for asnA, asnC and gidA